MTYTKFYLFGKKKSRGTFDDFYSTEKYASLEEAYKANDYVECDYVKDESGIIYIEARNVKRPEEKKYHQLQIQNCFAGIDMFDDSAACEIASTLL